MLSGAGKIAAVIGWPIAQSLSPALHGFWLNELGIDGALVPLAVRREDFATVVRGLQKAGLRGACVTLPHKEAALALCHEADAEAKATGAANLLIFDGGRILARNTDAPGLAASLGEGFGAGFVHGKTAVVLGAGGAARAALASLDHLGAAEIRVVNRSPERAVQMVAAVAPHLSATVNVAPSFAVAAADAALVVNTTSAGMKGAPSLALAWDALPRNAAFCDIVYNPLETGLLREARTHGHPTVDGLGMLMHQAVPAFEAFFGLRPAVTPALRRHLEEVLNARG